MCAHGKKRRVEFSGRHLGADVADLVLQVEFDSKIKDAPNLCVQHVARQPVFRNAKAHHAAGQGPRLDDLDGMTGPAQLICR